MYTGERKVRLLYYSGMVLLVLGTLDPMEGSVLIAAATILFAIKTRLTGGHFYKVRIIIAVGCMLGVASLFIISSFGGLGGKEGISWWWGLLILPYPISWLTTVSLLISEGIRRKK